jgi:hypothetical protein
MEREYVQYDEVEVITAGGNDAHFRASRIFLNFGG